MLKRVLVVVLAKRVAPPRPSKSTKMASPSSTLAHASNASLASTIAPPAPSPKANNSGFIETLNPSAAPQDVALFFVRRLCARFTARIRRRLRLCARFTARIRLCISAISPPGLNTPLWRRLFRRLGSIRLFGAGYFAAWAQYTGAAVLCARYTARIRTALRFAPPCPNRPT